MQFIPYIRKHYRTITLTSYLLPIIFAVIVSLAHVVSFWEITNPASWAIFLSVAVEVAVLSSIAASRLSNWAWLPFSIVTFIQIIGNVFFSYTNIDVTSTLFKNWVELFDPLFNWLGFETAGNFIVHKRILATFSGAMIPLISITFFHFFIRATKNSGEDVLVESKSPIENPVILTREPIINLKPETIVEPVMDIEPVAEAIHEPNEGVIEKWEESGLLEGLTNNTDSNQMALFTPNTVQIVPDDVSEPVVEESNNLVPIADPNQLNLFDPDEFETIPEDLGAPLYKYTDEIPTEDLIAPEQTVVTDAPEAEEDNTPIKERVLNQMQVFKK